MSRPTSTQASPALRISDETDHRRQLDLFIDGGDAVLIHDVMTGLVSRDVVRTEAGLCRLGRERPDHPDLTALTTLAEALIAPPVSATHAALTERIMWLEHTVLPAARRFLGASADSLLRPMWHALATIAADVPFDATHPQAHRAWLCQQYGGWTDVLDAIEKESRWAETPILCYWLGLARQHLGSPEIAIRSWLPLCWTDPVLFERNAPTVPNPTIRSAWIAFERASPFADSLADERMAAWFPAWLLLRHRGLSHLFAQEDIRDAGKAARVFRHLLVLLPLEQRGLTDELVRQRRVLQQLDERFFRYYMAVLR